MSADTVEAIRRQQVAEVNEPTRDTPADLVRAELEAEHGRVWTTDELSKDFAPQSFMAPYLVCIRNSDGKQGTLQFTHNPRFYFNFQPREG